jgi:hypothetical protein
MPFDYSWIKSVSIVSTDGQLLVNGMSPLIWSMAFRRCTHNRVTTHSNPLRSVFDPVIWLVDLAGHFRKGDYRRCGESDHSLRL